MDIPCKLHGKEYHRGARRSSINWILGLAERVNSAWELGLMQDSGHLPVLTWSAALKEVNQDQIIQMRPKSISWPTDLEEKVPEDLDDIMADMEARNEEDADMVVEYERDITTNQGGIVTFGDFPDSSVTFGNINPRS